MLHSLEMPIITVKDHWHEGGLVEAVLSALSNERNGAAFASLALSAMPHSGRLNRF
jgi:hypothetical protein